MARRRRWIQKLDEWFPPKLEEGDYEAQEPWIVKITFNSNDGITTFTEYLRYEWDNMYRLGGEEYWRRASYFAKMKAERIRKEGVRIREVDGSETNYPVHRVHVVEAMALVKEPQRAQAFNKG